MAAFYGSVRGNHGKASRLGSKRSGLTTEAASWQGAVQVDLETMSDGRVFASVRLMPWHGQGISKLLWWGPVDGHVHDPDPNVVDVAEF